MQKLNSPLSDLQDQVADLKAQLETVTRERDEAQERVVDASTGMNMSLLAENRALLQVVSVARRAALELASDGEVTVATCALLSEAFVDVQHPLAALDGGKA